MKTLRFNLIRFMLLGLFLAYGTVGVGQAQAAGPDSQLTLPAPYTVTASGQPSSLSPQAEAWFDGAIKESDTSNCIYHYTEPGAAGYLGYLVDTAAGLPKANTVYYMHVVVYGIGNSCSGYFAYIDIGLPPNTSFAISPANPAYCFLDGKLGTPTDCGLSLVASTIHPGMTEILGPRSPWIWPFAQGHYWEFQIPLISTAAVSGSNLSADIQMIDGNDDPWVYPTVPVFVAPPAVTAPGAFAKASPANGATGQATSLTLSWAASSGATSYDTCLETTLNNTCNTSWVSTGSAASKALSGLTPGATYYWQVRAINTGGTTYANGTANSFWSFTTQATVPQPPAAFGKSSPANAATGQATSLTLSWAASSGATSYETCLETTLNSTCNTSWVSTGSAASKALSGLAPGTTYFWQVRATNTGGTTYADGSTTWWSFTVAAQNQNPTPTLGGMNPDHVPAGSAGFTLTINGANFVGGCVVKWNETGLATTLVSSTQLTALVPANLVANAGTVNITLVNPAPGGGSSIIQTFSITGSTSGSKKIFLAAVIYH